MCLKVTLSYPLDFGDKTIDVNLIVFKLLEFNIIPGMDWLFWHFQSINFWSQVVSFHLLGWDYMEFVGSKLKLKLSVISMIQAEKDLASGVDVYLVHVVTKPIERKSVMRILIVEEFLDVFEDFQVGRHNF